STARLLLSDSIASTEGTPNTRAEFRSAAARVGRIYTSLGYNGHFHCKNRVESTFSENYPTIAEKAAMAGVAAARNCSFHEKMAPQLTPVRHATNRVPQAMQPVASGKIQQNA